MLEERCIFGLRIAGVSFANPVSFGSTSNVGEPRGASVEAFHPSVDDIKFPRLRAQAACCMGAQLTLDPPPAILEEPLA